MELKKTRKVIVLIVLIVVVCVICFGLTGCAVDIDENYDGLSVGFNYYPSGEYLVKGAVCAVKSEKTEFNINDVTLDIYYGWQDEPPYMAKQSDEVMGYTSVCALYVSDSDRLYSGSNAQGDFQRNDEAIFFLMETPMSEFISEDYMVTRTKRDGKQFQKKASLTIPKEVFGALNGELWLCISPERYFLNEVKTYDIDFFVVVRYSIDNGTVRLSKSSNNQF